MIYEIEGQLIEVDKELSIEEIEEIAATLGSPTLQQNPITEDASIREETANRTAGYDSFTNINNPLLSAGAGVLNGLTQGATLGFNDELAGGLNAIANVPSAAYNAIMGDGNFIDDVSSAYTRTRDTQRGMNEASQATQPLANTLGLGASLLMPGPKVPASIANIRALPEAVRYPISSAIRSAVTGGIYGAGLNENPDEFISDTLTMGGIAGAMGGGLNTARQISRVTMAEVIKPLGQRLLGGTGIAEKLGPALNMFSTKSQNLLSTLLNPLAKVDAAGKGNSLNRIDRITPQLLEQSGAME